MKMIDLQLGGSHAFEIPVNNISYDVEAFDRLIRSHGVPFEHYRAMQCPIGVVDKFEARSVNHQGHGCYNGFLYEKAGVISCSFTGNTNQRRQAEMGLVDGASVQVTPPRFYDDDPNKPVMISPFDRFYLKGLEASAVNWQLVEAHPTGVDYLQYPAKSVEYIVDANGVRYSPTDYRIQADGSIKWVGKNRPGFDPKTGKGVVYSIRYTYLPFWICSQLIHEIRVSRVDDPETGERQLHRMPYSILLKREIAFEGERRPDTVQNMTSLTDVYLPPSGSFGRR